MTDKMAFDQTIGPLQRGAELDLGATAALEGLDETFVPVEDTPSSERDPDSLGVDLRATGSQSTVLPKVRFEGETPKLTHHISKRYEILNALGEGALGEVVLVQDNDIRRKVAMKKLKPDRHQPATLHRFVEEIQMVGALDHPNIVPVHDVGVDDQGQFYFIMKYVEGQTLEELIESLQAGNPEALETFTAEVRTHLFLDILHAVRCAHEAGIIHRDLKPANVMVGTYGEAMVMDWGLAKRLKSDTPLSVELAAIPEQPDTALRATGRFDTKDGVLVGTPAYMSPEQAFGDCEHIDERSDIYALSVVFHELLTLRHYLHDKTTLNALLLAISSDDVAFSLASGTESQTAPELLWFLRKGMDKDPDKRFQTVAEMEATLKAIMSGKVQVRCHATFMRRMGHEWLHLINRHPMLTVGVAALILLFALWGVLSVILMAF